MCARNSLAIGKPVASLMLGCVVSPESRLGSQLALAHCCMEGIGDCQEPALEPIWVLN